MPLTGFAQQTNREFMREKSNNNTQKRVALVIGNGAYQKARALPNPPNDAADMAKALKSVGFEVLSGVNQNKRQIETLIRDFGAKLSANGGVGLFYYAGHGIQVSGENYLVPVEADIPEEDEVSYAAVPLSLVLTKMTTAKNDLNIVILDACRNNPFARSWRGFRGNSNSDGLAKISPPTGTLVLYATEPGKVASDGAGRNGLFTEALLKQINKPNLEYDQMVKAISADVWQKSNKQQLPWKEGNSLSDFYFTQKDSAVVEAIKNNQTTETVITAKTKAEQEKEAWDLVKNSSSPSDFRFYLEEFPDGANAAKAKIRLEELVWQTVRGSDAAKIRAYLNEFPNGANASAARIRIKQLEAASTTTTTPTTNNNSSNRAAGAISKSRLPNGAEMSFAYIPAGDFMMGSSESEVDEALRLCGSSCKRELFSYEAPKHKVSISEFSMGQTEVTQGQWQAVMGNNPSILFTDCASCPVEQVSWEDAQQFIAKLNAQNDGFKYRLPTEAEWEYAARAGTTGIYAGNLDSMAWYSANSDKKTHPVATKQANAWGLYDMHGNVREWVQDWFSGYPSEAVTNPSGAGTGSHRVNRGGSWNNDAVYLRSANRIGNTPSFRFPFLGFRVVRS